MNSLAQDYVKKRKIYRKFFEKSRVNIEHKIASIKSKYYCNNCDSDCRSEYELFDEIPEKCVFLEWRKEVFEWFKKELKPQINNRFEKILSKRENYHCEKCSLCCNFACSEYSYADLNQKAKNGDAFAKQFISIFEPYNSVNEAKKVYPEYVELLEKENDSREIYIYHCKKIGSEKLCPDYENRPQICKDFPDNPLLFLHPKCGFFNWKDDVEVESLSLMALAEIVDYYLEHLKVNF